MESIHAREGQLFKLIEKPKRFTHNEAEAILMAEHQVKQLQLDALQRGGKR